MKRDSKFLSLIFFIILLNVANSSKFNVSNSNKLGKSTYSKVEVCAKAGCVRGKVESGRIKPYDAFYGIPYAEPPIGQLRFENPVPYEGWTGYWDATYPRNGCLQRNFFVASQLISGSEDCLYLNVYRPITWKYGKKIPVMVWIHGGAWMAFSSSPKEYGPEYFMDNGEVILVTLNYRLGIFGFLCSGDEATKGNFGLKDQQLALQWVAANIEYFGGDSSSITLFGQSAGAASVHLQMMNPTSQALFHRVILLSGSALSPWVVPQDAEHQFRQAAKFVGITDWETASTYDLTNELKNFDAETLNMAIEKFFIFTFIPVIPLGICLEGNWDDAFIQEDPKIIWAQGNYVPKPILIGTTLEEGALGASIALNETLIGIFNENIYSFLPILLSMDPRYSSYVLKYYFGEKDYIDNTNLQQFIKLLSDRWFVYPMIVFVNQFTQSVDVQTNPIYIYEHDFKSNYTWFQILTGADVNFGVTHNDDLFYLFTMPELIPIFNTTSPEGKMSDLFIRTLINFATRKEVKVWRRVEPCTSTSKPFCDRQIFERFEKSDPNLVQISVSNQIDEGMFKLWSKVDNGVSAIIQN